MARVNAVRNTLWKSIDYENRMVHDVLEKEGKIVDLMFSKEVSELLKELKEYRTEHDIEDGGYMCLLAQKSMAHGCRLHQALPVTGVKRLVR
mgnify:CR=1 FL=1